MAIYYIDPINGDDANNGLSWATAWKTITSGATAARIAPGDIIRIAKSPPPVSIGQATWTNLSKVVTLATAQTQNIDLCEEAWTPSANVTASLSTTRKQGNYSVQLAIGANFTTGKIAYRTLSSLDLSSYQKISFWFRNDSVMVAANTFRLVLCSDTDGNTIVDSFPIPEIKSSGRWLPLTLERTGGGNLGSNIQSVAIYADADPGVLTIYLDNIIACTTDGLNLQSLISKNSNEQGGDEAWYGLQSINGTTLMLDNCTNTNADAGRGYYGTSETVETFKRETFKVQANTYYKAVHNIQDSGTASAPITFSGGWNTQTNVRDGVTIYDGLSGWGYGLSTNSKWYLVIEGLGFCRYSSGFRYDNSYYVSSSIEFCGNCGIGVQTVNGARNFTSVRATNNNAHYGVDNDDYWTTWRVGQANNNLSYALYTSGGYARFEVDSVCNNNYGVCVYQFAPGVVIQNAYISDNSVASFQPGLVDVYCRNVFMGDATEVTPLSRFNDQKVYSTNHDQVDSYHCIFMYGGRVYTDSSIRHRETGCSWRLDPTHSDRHELFPVALKIATIAVQANSQVTVSAWFRRNNTGITGRLICKGGQIAGVPDSVYANMTAAANTWEQLTIQFTPTEPGVVEIEAHAWGGTTYSVWVDDLSVTQS